MGGFESDQAKAWTASIVLGYQNERTIWVFMG